MLGKLGRVGSFLGLPGRQVTNTTASYSLHYSLESVIITNNHNHCYNYFSFTYNISTSACSFAATERLWFTVCQIRFYITILDIHVQISSYTRHPSLPGSGRVQYTRHHWGPRRWRYPIAVHVEAIIPSWSGGLGEDDTWPRYPAADVSNSGGVKSWRYVASQPCANTT